MFCLLRLIWLTNLKWNRITTAIIGTITIKPWTQTLLRLNAGCIILIHITISRQLITFICTLSTWAFKTKFTILLAGKICSTIQLPTSIIAIKLITNYSIKITLI